MIQVRLLFVVAVVEYHVGRGLAPAASKINRACGGGKPPPYINC